MNNKQKLHPIQIEGIKVRELFIRSNSLTDDQDNNLEGSFKFKVAHSEYNHEKSIINVGLIIELGQPDVEQEKSDCPIDLRVHLLAQFTIDKENFPIEKIEHWAQHNAPMILYPYAREQVYALSSRVASAPILLPLLQVPTIKI